MYVVILNFKDIEEQFFSLNFHGIRASFLLKVIHLFLVSSTGFLFFYFFLELLGCW